VQKSTLVITPMSFIVGIFFSLKIPPGSFHLLSQIIPLTHSSLTIRVLFLGQSVEIYHYLIMAGYTLLFFFLAVRQASRAIS